MIVTELYKGQGLGNQLACYITTRVIALDKGYDFGIQHPERFKGIHFLKLDFGKKVIGGKGPEGGPPRELPQGIRNYYNERKVTHPITGADIRTYDKNLIEVLDSTKIDGLMQGEQYIEHRKNEIREWLTVDQKYDCYEYADENTCVINFRGGEYSRHPEFYLKKEYWSNAVTAMRNINLHFRFIVITDDVLAAKKFFPEFPVFHFSIGKDYSIIKNAYYLILSNSTFAWFPAWLNTNLKFCIAPKYFARHNISDGYWSLGTNLTKGWQYLDRDGVLLDYETCAEEWEIYQEQHKDWFAAPKIHSNFLVISNYNNDLRWVPEFTDNYLIYDRSEAAILPTAIDLRKVIKSPNVGYNSYDYCRYIVDHYDNLPECVIFAKGWSFPRHVRREYFERVMNNECFTPLEDTKKHDPRFPISFFSPEGGYCEINNSWYLKHWKTKYFKKYNDFLRYMYKDPVLPLFTRFAPGGDYIVPRANILKLPKVVYQNLMVFMGHCQEPGETHLIERAMYTLWTSNFELNPQALIPVDETFSLPQKSFSTILKQKAPASFKNNIKSVFNLIKNVLTVLRRPVDLARERKRKKTWLSNSELAQYRKKIKIYDAFNFFNELEVLDIRLHILDPYVDKFVIVESRLTHSGKPKPLYYEEHKERFAEFAHKIFHYVIDRPIRDYSEAITRLNTPSITEFERKILARALTSDLVPQGDNDYLRDFYEKESVINALLAAGAQPEDFCYISDLDEIWNPKAVIDWSKDAIFKYKQDAYTYFLNNRSNEDWLGWCGTIATKFKNIVSSNLNDLRTYRKTKYIVIPNGGWHFTFQGGEKRIREKLAAYSYHELNEKLIGASIDAFLKKNKDIKGRFIKFWKDESDLPEWLLNHKNRFPGWFR